LLGKLLPEPPDANLKFRGVVSESNACIKASCCAAAPSCRVRGAELEVVVDDVREPLTLELICALRLGLSDGPLKKKLYMIAAMNPKPSTPRNIFFFCSDDELLFAIREFS
jgi:hypothetical protein